MKRFAFLAVLLLPGIAHAKLNVLTTIPDLQAVVAEIGGDLVSVDSIAKGTQDPHYIEAKPSFMVKANRADLYVAVGLELELGWLPSIIQGARNPKIRKGQPGHLELGPTVQPLEVPSGKITRAQGDVHPLGNPHFWLDPIRLGEAAVAVATRLGELDAGHAAQYTANAKALQKRLADKTKGWQERVKASGVTKVVTYHRTLTYFLDRFGIANPAVLEPKPGIPPTSGHMLEVIRKIKEQKIPLVLIENFFDAGAGKRLKEEAPGIRVEAVPVEVEGAAEIKSPDDLYEALVRAIEGRK